MDIIFTNPRQFMCWDYFNRGGSNNGRTVALDRLMPENAYRSGYNQAMKDANNRKEMEAKLCHFRQITHYVQIMIPNSGLDRYDFSQEGNKAKRILRRRYCAPTSVARPLLTMVVSAFRGVI
jgi:hypothetical protein